MLPGTVRLTIKGTGHMGTAQDLHTTVRCGWFPSRDIKGALGFRTFRPGCAVRPLTREAP